MALQFSNDDTILRIASVLQGTDFEFDKSIFIQVAADTKRDYKQWVVFFSSTFFLRSQHDYPV